MKKFLALALAIVMMAALAVPAFAAYEMTDEAGKTVQGLDDHYGVGNDNPKQPNYLTDAADSQNTDTTLIKYGVAQAYVVTIPAQIDLHENKTDSTNKTIGYVYGIELIGVYDVVIAGDEELNIYAYSANFGTVLNESTPVSAWVLKNVEANATSADVNYKFVTVDSTKTGEGASATYSVDETNYMTSDEYDAAAGVVSGDGVNANVNGQNTANATAGKVLNCAVADGNKGTTGSEKYANLYFSSKGTAQEGTYQDTITFNVRIQKVSATVNP